jgi:hypothetical protein
MTGKHVRLATTLGVAALAIWAVGWCAAPAQAKPRTKTVRASMYGGPHDHCGSTIAASHAGRLAYGRNIIALRTHHFGDLWKISYRRHGKWHSSIFINLDYGPAKWTHRKVDIAWGGAKRISLPGLGYVRITKVGHLPRKYWRKFGHYKTLKECKRKLRWR